MSGGWIAGCVKARLLAAERRVGLEQARELAASSSLRDALVTLGHTPYRREVTLDLDLAGAQRAVATKTLVELRLLAGWLPGEALGLLRAIGGWYELANLEDRLAYLSGGALRRPFELGSLAVAWPRAAGAQSLTELRRSLVASSWGDPGGDTAAQVGLGLRLAWARRLVAEAPETRAWTAGAAALLLARELYVVGVPVELLPIPALRIFEPGWQSATTFARFVAALPADAAWAFVDTAAPDDLWRAEARWWRRVEADAELLVHGALGERRVVIGAVALLGADARRVATALSAVVRRGLSGVEEVLDAAA